GAKPGRVQSYGDAGIYLGAMSLGTGTADQAYHRMVQISRTLNPVDEDKQKALAEAGITDKMDDPARLIQLGDFFKANPNLDPVKWMTERNIGSEATREAVTAGMKVSDVLKQRLETARAKLKGNQFGKQVIAENGAARANERVNVNAEARSITEVVDKAEGAGVETFETAKKFAEERMRLNDSDYRSPFRRVLELASSPISYAVSGVGGYDNTRESHAIYGAIPNLRREAERVGIKDLGKRFPGLGSGDYETRAQAFEAASREVSAA
ncbi:hypothetical protein ACYOEI_41475, partial [Singulisphaera rosea]